LAQKKITQAEIIRRALKRDTILMPGVYDALSARIASQAGFEVIFISGYSVSATALGESHFGLLSLGNNALHFATGHFCRLNLRKCNLCERAYQNNSAQNLLHLYLNWQYSE
jgi:ketopantoate hydroxymethyltransferase